MRFVYERLFFIIFLSFSSLKYLVYSQDKPLKVGNFFEAHCTKCHNSQKKKGGINLSELNDFRIENAKLWQEILDNLQRGDMPPEESTQPSISNRKTFVAQVHKELDKVFADSKKRDF